MRIPKTALTIRALPVVGVRLLPYCLFLSFLFPGPGTPLAQSESMPDSKNYIIKLTERGIEPKLLQMRPDDSVVFFLNATKDALTSLEVNFKGQTMHCASANMRVDDDETLRSTAPFGPQDFATTCFHSPGEYTYKVYGLPNSPKGLSGTVILR